MATTTKKKVPVPTQENTSTAQKVQEVPENTAPLQELEAEQQNHVLVPADTTLGGMPPASESEAPTPASELEQVPARERTIPYKATVAVALAVLHKAVGLGTADMLKPIGSLRQGAMVTVTGRKGTYAQLKNGLYILEAFLEVKPID